MDERRVAEYFFVAGLPSNPVPLADFTCDGATLKSTHSLPPITDIGIVNRSLGEVLPDGYTCIENTVGGLSGNLNHGVLRSQEIYLCFRRGRDKPPLVDIGVLLEGRERLLPDSQVVEFTVENHNGNINANGVAAYMTYRRATDESTCNELVVSDICLIMSNKGEMAPHSYCTIERNLNKGTMVGSDIFVCYRKSVNRTNHLAYKAGILDCYPLEPRPNFPVPDSLALFCLPMGATLEAWAPTAAMPDQVFSTFVLTILPSPSNSRDHDSTNEGIEKVYGAAITFYERYPHDKLTAEQRTSLQLNDHFGRRNLIYTNKCICILSMWPFFDTFEKFLKYLHKMALSANHKVPIERYVWHMLECVPFPSARRPRILIQLDAKEGISLAQPEDSPIPLSGACFRKLVMCLRPEGCLLVLLYALTEQKILLHSLRPDVLTAVSEALTMIIFPFHWQCPYIPLCPLGLSDFLDAPTPFLLGLDSRFFDIYDPPTDVICIDLDTAAISIPEDKKHLTIKLLPKKAARILKNSLENLCGTIKKIDHQLQEHHMKPNIMLDQNIDIHFKMKRKEQELEVEIQETFLRFTATILKNYSQYLLPIITVKPHEDQGTPALFDVDGFVRTREKAYQRFYEMLVSTQMFSKFIEERSFVSDKDASLVFFDDCMERVRDEDPTIKLLEVEPASSEHTFFLLPPEPPLYAPIDGYAYEGFPKLRPDFFPAKEPPKALPPEFSTPVKQKGTGAAGTPGSPLARRSKHEIRSAQKLASKHYQTPMMWAKCLLSSCFSLWFAQLPAFITIHAQKGRVLDLAFHILQRIQKQSLSHHDEVCYRVMMQLCGVYSKPVLAVKTLCEMRNAGIIPNAITYGYYNRALLQSKWNPSNLLWNKLRNVIFGVSAFRQCGRERAQRRKSVGSVDEVDKYSNVTDGDSTSRISLESATSVESHHATQFKTDTLSSDPGYCSISENCDAQGVSNTSPSSTNTVAPTDLSRSESNCSLSPTTNLPQSTPSSSYSSPTATVTYDTAPSSPLAPPSTVSFSGPITCPPSEGCLSHSVNLHSVTSVVTASYCPEDDASSITLNEGNSIQSSTAISSVTPFNKRKSRRVIAPKSKTLDFTQSDELRKKFGYIVRSSTAGLASGVQMSLLETHPLLVNSAGLLMTSPINATHLDPHRAAVARSNDLAEALSETLEKYDLIQEPSMLLPTTLDPHPSDRGPPDYLRSQSFGKDEKIVKKLLNLVYPLEDSDRISMDGGRSESDSSPSNTLMDPRLKRTSEPEKSPERILQPTKVSKNRPKVLHNKNVKVNNEFLEDSDEEGSSNASESSISKKHVVPQPNSMGTKTFFSRNTPERISNLWRKGVLGADERLRGMWRKNSQSSSSRSSSKETLKNESSENSSRNSSKERKNVVSKGKNSNLNLEESKDKSSPAVLAYNPLVVAEELVEGSGRRAVIAGDPLGALMEQHVSTPDKPPLHPKAVTTSASSQLARRNRVARSNTFSPSTQKSTLACTDEETTRSLSSTNLFSEPFSGEEFQSPSLSHRNSDCGSSTDESLASASWVPPFKLAISGTTTLELASSVASQGFKQASKHIESLRTQYLDPAMVELANPSNFSTRKNELISGSLSSMRSAVTSLSKKYNILREAISATPSKQSWKSDEADEDMIDGFWGRRDSYDTRFNPSEEPIPCSSLSGDTDPGGGSSTDRSLPSSWTLAGPFCLGIWITSCSRCHNCKGILYDEEIMAGWRPDDSNLNTKCWHCKRVTVPFLTVSLYYLRHLPKPPPESAFPTKDTFDEGSHTPKWPKSPKRENRRKTREETASSILERAIRLEPLTVPYLSPLVLRKELETILGHDGESSLTHPSFPDHHPILYWNLLWYFSRLRLPSHLSGLCLSTLVPLKDRVIHESWKVADWRNVFVKCLWDNPLYHQELGAPLYVQWKENYNPSTLVKALTPHRAKVPKDVLESYLTLLHFNQIDRCLELMLQTIKRRPAELRYNHFPLYRDLFFFALTALPNTQLNTIAFEQEFRREFDKLLAVNSKLLTEGDGPPPIPSIFCRKYFWDLSL